MKKLFLCLFVASAFLSCSDNDGNESIRLTGNTATSQIVYADETHRPEGIRFTATASWTATVKNATTSRNSEVEWLSLNRYSGDAGEYTLTMTLQPNLTGQDRVAEIIINCADAVIRIRVEQKGTKADGEKPEVTAKRLVDSIIQKWEESKDEWKQAIIEFTYNPDGTIKFIAEYDDLNKNNIIDPQERNEGKDWQTEFTYDTANKKVYTTSIDYEDEYYDKDIVTGELSLNDEGFAVKAKYVTNQDGKTETHHIFYQDGQAVSTEVIQNDGSVHTEKATWKNGNLIRVSDNEDFSDITYGDLLNHPDVPIDLNFLIANTSMYDTFCENGNLGLKVCGFFGKRSKNMMTNEKDNWKESYTYTYENDTEGFITKITVDNNGGGHESNANSIYIINYRK